MADRPTNSFFVPGEQRAGRVNDLFAEVAPRYDLINDVQSLGLHRLWKRRVIRAAKVGPGQSALDLCCGTGDLTLALARTGAAATGLDFSEPMLAVARQRARRLIEPDAASGAGPVEFQQGDALRLPFAERAFDAVTIGYGLRNLSDPRAGLAEMGRVLRSGGRLVVLEFGKPENALWRGFYFAYLRWVVPVFGRLFCGNASAYAYILESLQNYPAQAGVTRLLQELGFVDIRVTNLLGGAMSIHEARKPGVVPG